MIRIISPTDIIVEKAIPSPYKHFYLLSPFFHFKLNIFRSWMTKCCSPNLTKDFKLSHVCHLVVPRVENKILRMKRLIKTIWVTIISSSGIEKDLEFGLTKLSLEQISFYLALFPRFPLIWGMVFALILRMIGSMVNA